MSARPRFERTTIIFGLFFALTGFFVFKLFERQVLEHSQFAQAAEDQSTSTSAQPAQRGQILAKDKDGKLFALAVSDWQYQLIISPRQVKNPDKLVAALKEDLPTLDTAEVSKKIDNDKIYIPAVLKGIDGKTAERISAKDYAGVFLVPTLIRVYPDGPNIASQVLGFIGADGEGKYGIEATHDKDLRGRAGDEKTKRDSFGRLIDILGGREAEAGKDVVLTIDYNLQFTVETELKKAVEEFQADSGSIVVMDPKTGAVLALAGQPNFDPNKFTELPAAEQFKFLMPAVSNVYEAGSVFKPLTMAMAIDLNHVQPDTTNTFGKSVTVNGKEIFNAELDAFGTETMTQVLENSDNVAMVWLSSLIGAEKEREYFEKFGIGTKTGVDLVGEQSGRLPPQKEWNDLLRSTAAFGQGVSTTVVQLAAAYSVIANGGLTVSPHLVDKYIIGDKTELVEVKSGNQVISTETAAKVRGMLVSVVEKGHGKRARVEGIRVGGKTGTAQVPDPSGGYYEDRHTGTFAGLFPADDPRFVMVVRLDNPKTVRFAESSAAPTFGKIANWITNYYGLR